LKTHGDNKRILDEVGNHIFTKIDQGIIKTWELGLISKTFKLLGNQEIQIDRDNSFLNYLNSGYDSNAKSLAKKEFDKTLKSISKERN
jgi:hypothetical protein